MITAQEARDIRNIKDDTRLQKIELSIKKQALKGFKDTHCSLSYAFTEYEKEQLDTLGYKIIILEENAIGCAYKITWDANENEQQS